MFIRLNLIIYRLFFYVYIFFLAKHAKLSVLSCLSIDRQAKLSFACLSR